MYKGIVIQDTDVASGVNVPFTTARNTNANTRYNETDNEVEITSEGYYDVMSTLVVSSTAGGLITAQLYANGVAISGASSQMEIEAGETTTFTILDNVKVATALFGNVANISIKFNANVTVNDAILLVEKRK